MELKNLLKGLRPTAIGGIKAEHVSLSKRFFHLAYPPQGAFTFQYWFSMINIPGQQIEANTGIKDAESQS
jgi:hypothetical protein